MRQKSLPASGFLFSLLIFSAFFYFARLPTRAEQLPVKTYTIANGLARDYVNRIKQDSHGLIWFCTAEGISRFDGYNFTNYGVAEGLPHRFVTEFLETRSGVYLFGTQNGLVEFNPNNTNPNNSYFTKIPLGEDEDSNSVTEMVEDSEGVIWVGTAKGVNYLTKTAVGWQAVFIDKESSNGENITPVNTLAFDKKNSLWIGTAYSGLYRRLPDGKFEHYTVKNGLSQDGISDILQDRDGKIWVGTGTGLTLLVDNPRPNENIAERVYTTKDGLLHNFIEILFQSSDGRLWVGGRGGVNYLIDLKDNKGAAFRGYTYANGLPSVRMLSITEDKDNNLWLGAENGGAKKLPMVGFTSYFEEDGLGTARIAQIFADRSDNIYGLSVNPGNLLPLIVRFDGQSFVKETLDLPPETLLTWGWNHLILQDIEGDWWFATAQGIFRFTGKNSSGGLRGSPLTKIYGVKDGMDDDDIFRLFEDARGDIWFSTIGALSRSSVQQWERKTGKIRIYTPQELATAATAFANDSEGNLWIGFYSGGIARYRDGRFTVFTEKEGMPKGFVRHLFFDSKNRLWIGTSLSGVVRVDKPSAEKLQFVNYSSKDGISSDQVSTVTEDKWGRIYLGTGRGIDRLDPETNQIKHFTTADGLSDNFVNVSMADSNGVLWFGTLRGISRFVPEQDKPHPPPSILISGLRIEGVKQSVSEFGKKEVSIPDLSYNQNQLEIDFLSISYASGDFLRYQYKFENSGGDWSEPSQQRTVTLPNLPSGNYRFLVRAVNSDGIASENPAIVSFKILSPIWARWWFIALAAVLVTIIILSLYRYRTANLREINLALSEANRAEEDLRRSREERIAELEKVRSRIATDLHDDIGASLTQIAILSEVAQAQGKKGNGASAEPLTKISDVSNELVSTMSDIVWSINPTKDHLSDLTQRMRRFASDILSSKGIAFHFDAPPMNDEIPIGTNMRREFFLVFKEAVNNIVKHSKAKSVNVEFQNSADFLTLKITDDGIGFDAKNFSNSGNGILSMKKRALEMNGEFEIVSENGKGTEILLTLPLDVKNISEHPTQAGGDILSKRA